MIGELHVKKSRKNRNNLKAVDNVYEPAFESQNWHPLDDVDRSRDKKYVKNVKPRSDEPSSTRESHPGPFSLTLAIGPAGTGKTYLAISAAAEALISSDVERIILSRPAWKPEKV